VIVADDGKGFNPGAVGSSHYGLGIMNDRARLIGADVRIESEVGKGTQVRIVLPREQPGVLPTHLGNA
jgi:signal transduction histidine kinase